MGRLNPVSTNLTGKLDFFNVRANLASRSQGTNDKWKLAISVGILASVESHLYVTRIGLSSPVVGYAKGLSFYHLSAARSVRANLALVLVEDGR